MNVDKLFEERVRELGDWRGEKLTQLRKIVEKAAPEAELCWKWGSPVWMQDGLLLSLGSFSNHVKVHFFKGASIPDIDKLFNAGLEAKLTRGIDICEDSAIDEKSLIRVIKLATDCNKK